MFFEGTWWKNREVPQALPFLLALKNASTGLDLSHKTFRSAEDLRYWFGRIGNQERTFVYLAMPWQRRKSLPGRWSLRRDQQDVLPNWKSILSTFQCLGVLDETGGIPTLFLVCFLSPTHPPVRRENIDRPTAPGCPSARRHPGV